MKKVLLNLLFLGLLLSPYTLWGQTVTKRIIAIDDTYVYADGGKDKTVIRGLTQPDFLKSYTAKEDPDTGSYKTFLKFDLQSICNNPNLIESVHLKVYGNEDAGEFVHTLVLSEVSEINWNEDDLSYSSLSTVGKITPLTELSDITVGKKLQWYEWDITSAIKSYKQQQKNRVAFMINDATDVRGLKTNKGSIVTFHSKEHTGGNAPYLEVIEKDISDLILPEIKIDGVTINEYNPYKLEYHVLLKAGTTAIPKLSYAGQQTKALINVQQATRLDGTDEERTTTLTVKNNGKILAYHILFETAPLTADISLQDIRVGDEHLEFFQSGQQEYMYYLPYTETKVPQITATPGNINQKIEITQATSIVGDESSIAQIQIVSGDGNKRDEYRIRFQRLPKLDLYLCIGQSNMAGRGYMNEVNEDRQPIDNCYLFTPGFNWEAASNPMNRYSNIRKELKMQRVSPTYGFARKLSSATHLPIGVVVNAKGGSSMKEWGKGAELYEQSIKRAKEAMKWGEFRAIIWHQGESNSNDKAILTYPEELKSMVESLRIDLSSPQLYFVAGELAHWRKTSANFNAMISRIASFIPNSDYVSAEGLTPLIDTADPHFDRISNIVLGERYADKVLERIKKAGMK